LGKQRPKGVRFVVTTAGVGVSEKEIQMAIMKRVFVIFILFLFPTLIKADSVWTYQGNTIGQYGVSEGFALTGTVVLNNNDQVTAWNFVADRIFSPTLILPVTLTPLLVVHVAT
jgi:hypothetical protein